MANVSFKEAQAIAISEARRYNAMGGTQRWKTVSMDKNGNWYADECKPTEMTPDYVMGWNKSPYGFDQILNVPKCDTPICDWEKSVAEVD
jgi:hypothetical protein